MALFDSDFGRANRRFGFGFLDRSKVWSESRLQIRKAADGRKVAALWTIFGTKLVALLARLGIQWYLWLTIGVAAGVAMTLIVVYQDKISEWLLKIFNKKREVKNGIKEVEVDGD